MLVAFVSLKIYNYRLIFSCRVYHKINKYYKIIVKQCIYYIVYIILHYCKVMCTYFQNIHVIRKYCFL